MPTTPNRPSGTSTKCDDFVTASRLGVFVLATVRGDHDVNEGKVKDEAGAPVELAPLDDDEARSALRRTEEMIALAAAGGFEALTHHLGEDTAMAERLRRAGFRPRASASARSAARRAPQAARTASSCGPAPA